MRLDRPAAITAIAAAAMALLPIQAMALGQAQSQVTQAAAPVTELAPLVVAAEPASQVAVPVTAQHENLPAMAAKQNEDPGYDRFARRWPEQAAATEDVRQADTTRWALLIGINVMLGKVADNQGSAQDATDLHAFLLQQGWRDDHIVLITDTDATRENIMAGMTWLARKTTSESVAIMHYSGHSKKWYDQDHDGDGEITDEGLWPTDDKFIVDSEMVRQLSGVQAGAFWISIGACNSQGFNDAGLARPGRLLTFSSAETEKSYEDPSVHNSVYGYYLIDEGLLQGFGDTNADGQLTVEESFAFATPRARTRTEGQRHGTQNGVMVDQLNGDFTFDIPEPPPEPAEPEQDSEDPEDSGRGGILCPIICNRNE